MCRLKVSAMPTTAQTRYMRHDVFQLDDIACITMHFPDKLSPAELEDVKAWFALRVRQWERAPFIASAPAATLEPVAHHPA